MHQLVLQFPVDSTAGYDDVIALEDRLLDALEGQADVDGHDVGGGFVQIFILAEDAPATFEAARAGVPSPLWENARAGYEPDEDADYVPLWPPGLEHFELEP